MKLPKVAGRLVRPVYLVYLVSWFNVLRGVLLLS